MDNPAEAVACRSCGVLLEVSPPAVGAPPPPPVEAPRPPVAFAASPAPAPGVPVGEVRVGLVATGTQTFGFWLHGLTADATLIVVILSWVGVRALDWGQRGSGGFLEGARPAPIFLIGSVAILIAWALGVRRLLPRMRDVGGRGVRAAGRHMQEQHGIGLLLARRGVVAGPVVSLVIWLGLEASAVWNFTRADDLGWELRPGLYAALILPIVGALGAILVLDRRGARMVRMDSRGDVFE